MVELDRKKNELAIEKLKQFILQFGEIKAIARTRLVLAVELAIEQSVRIRGRQLCRLRLTKMAWRGQRGQSGHGEQRTRGKGSADLGRKLGCDRECRSLLLVFVFPLLLGV